MAAIRNNLEFVIKIEMKTILISPVHLISLRANGAIRSPLKDVIEPPIPKIRPQISTFSLPILDQVEQTYRVTHLVAENLLLT